MKKIIKINSILGFLLLGMWAWSPIDGVQDIISKLEIYYKEYPQVRVHLIFNQPKYSPGDTAFFRAFFLTEDFRPIADKQILTLEVKDKSGNNVQVQNFRVIDGEGNNQIIFPTTISPAEYVVVVYSEWMKNFDPSLYFKKNIVIAGRKQLLATKESADTLSFYSEGGYVVEGIENRMIVKSNSKGAGKILDQTGLLVTEFQLDAHGMSEVKFIPKEGNSYHGVLNGVNKEFPLTIFEDKCAFKVMPYGSGGVEISITTSPNSPLGKQELYFIALSKGRITYSTTAKLENNRTNISVGNLHPGLNQFFLFDRKYNVVGERIYYVAPATADATITANSESVGPRELVDLEVSISDESGRPIGGVFTTRVLNSPLFSDGPAASFEMEMNIFNDLPALRFEFEKSDLTEDSFLPKLDEFLITQRWKRINWAEVISPSRDRAKYPFKYSLDLKGKAYFKASGDPVPDSTLVMIYLQKSMAGYEGYTDKRGWLSFPFLYDFSGTDQAFYMMEFRKKEKHLDYVIKPEQEISTSIANGSSEINETDAYGEYKFRKNIINRSFEFFASPEKAIDAKIVNPNTEFEDELGGADVTIKVEDYLVFPTMPDLIHEVISGLQTRTTGATRTARVVFIRNTYTVIPKGDPLYIIDGIFSKNTEFFLNLNPEDVFSIKLVNNENKLKRFGGLGKNGIVIVQTKKSVAKDVIANSTIFPISGLSKELDYKTPSYTGAHPLGKPDLRSSIYWNPKLSAGASGQANLKFYTSDDATPLTVEVQGLTNDGRAFSARETIIVRPPSIRP